MAVSLVHTYKIAPWLLWTLTKIICCVSIEKSLERNTILKEVYKNVLFWSKYYCFYFYQVFSVVTGVRVPITLPSVAETVNCALFCLRIRAFIFSHSIIIETKSLYVTQKWTSGCHWTIRLKADAKRCDSYHRDVSKGRHSYSRWDSGRHSSRRSPKMPHFADTKY